MNKPRKKTYEVIPSDHEVHEMIAEQLADTAHADIEDCTITPIWNLSWKGDKFCEVTIVTEQMMIVMQANGITVGPEIIVKLNKPAWYEHNEEWRVALIDWALTHPMPSLVEDPATGEWIQKVDEHGNRIWKLRPYDMKDFQCVLKRRGAWHDGIPKSGNLFAIEQPGKRITADDRLSGSDETLDRAYSTIEKAEDSLIEAVGVA